MTFLGDPRRTTGLPVTFVEDDDGAREMTDMVLICRTTAPHPFYLATATLGICGLPSLPHSIPPT